jgi:hypothetical protein
MVGRWQMANNTGVWLQLILVHYGNWCLDCLFLVFSRRCRSQDQLWEGTPHPDGSLSTKPTTVLRTEPMDSAYLRTILGGAAGHAGMEAR